MPRRGVTGERLIALFLLGACLFVPPWLSVFNRPVQVLGLPLLYVYLFAAWAVLIAMTALIVAFAGGDGAFDETPDGGGADASNERED
jgi:hypothetical protein